MFHYGAMKMKFFTIQSSRIIDSIKKEDYYPDFTFSEFPLLSDTVELLVAFHGLYFQLLTSFNQINQSKYRGLAFAFTGDSTETSPKDINQFVEYINNNSETVGSFISLLKDKEENYSVAEIEYAENEFNPLLIDYNDWQYLMPSYDEENDEITSQVRKQLRQMAMVRIFQSMLDKEYSPQILRSPYPVQNWPKPLIDPSVSQSCRQAHVPYIKKSNLVNTYPFSNIASRLDWKNIMLSGRKNTL